MLLRAKISKGGKVVIPVLLRRKLSLSEGEEITFEIEGDNIIISSLKSSLKKARRIVGQYHPGDESLVEKLIAARHEEADHE